MNKRPEAANRNEAGAGTGLGRAGSESTALQGLVARTAGPQPWRRVFHAANGGAMAAALAALPITRETALAVLGAVLILLFLMDLMRLVHAGANVLFFRAFWLFASPREADNIASSTWYVLGVWFVIALFPRNVAVAAILILALADPVAGYVGRRWGRTRVGRDGTLEGTLAFFLVCFVVLVSVTGPVRALLAAALTTVAERLPRLLDDNVTIPLAAGAALWLARRM